MSKINHDLLIDHMQVRKGVIKVVMDHLDEGVMPAQVLSGMMSAFLVAIASTSMNEKEIIELFKAFSHPAELDLMLADIKRYRES